MASSSSLFLLEDASNLLWRGGNNRPRRRRFRCSFVLAVENVVTVNFCPLEINRFRKSLSQSILLVLHGTAVCNGEGMKNAKVPYQKQAVELQQQHSPAKTALDIVFIGILHLFFLRQQGGVCICKVVFNSTAGLGDTNAVSTRLLSFEEEYIFGIWGCHG
jgi:hypothetical protein